MTANFLTDRNVYVFGAGFSADANAPLLYNFLDKSRQLLDDPASDLDELERSEFRAVFEFRRKMAQAREKVKIDLDNIEQLFGLVEMEQRLHQGNSGARSATVYLIAKTLDCMISKAVYRQPIEFTANPLQPKSTEILRDYGFKSEEQYTPPRYSLDMYDFFGRLISGQFDATEKRSHRKDTVITFNYDLVLDHAFGRAGIPIFYHLPAEYVSAPAANRDECFSLLKLHGSTNWGICSKCKQHIFVSLDKMTSSSGVFRNLECRKCHSRAFQHMLVPPSWDKTEYQELMRPVWSQAVAAIREATRICIIGYSLPESDAYFRYLLTLGLSENHGLYKFIVVDLVQDPSQVFMGQEQNAPVLPQSLSARYCELLEDLFRERRFTFHGEGFWHWLVSGSVMQELGRGELIRRA